MRKKPARTEALNLLDKSTSALSVVVVAGGPKDRVPEKDTAEASVKLVADVAPERLV